MKLRDGLLVRKQMAAPFARRKRPPNLFGRSGDIHAWRLHELANPCRYCCKAVALRRASALRRIELWGTEQRQPLS
jgi:hypothetical protein